ncbi:hypothetical protein D9M68_406580 [compost metagenome]
MKPDPQFAPYPEARPPVYARWWISGAVLLAMTGTGGVLLRPFVEPRAGAALAAMTLLLWVLVLLLRTLYYRLNRHIAYAYAKETAVLKRRWWTRHRQQAALMDFVLIGALGSTALHWRRVLSRQAQKPPSRHEGAGQAIRLMQVFEQDAGDRECELARQLAMEWVRQRQEPGALAPLRCYWQGSPAGWSCFAEQMALDCPDMSLPEQPEPWRGVASLDSIIDLLQDAPRDARVLCAGSQSTTARAEAPLPAGEAAVLWLLGPHGGSVRVSRGEWYATDQEPLADVARRALQQAELEKPAEACIAFSQPSLTELSELGWNLTQHQQDDNWGELEGLQPLVVLTLAACHAQQHGKPCAWLATDPENTLAFGVVRPNEEPV